MVVDPAPVMSQVDWAVPVSRFSASTAVSAVGGSSGGVPCPGSTANATIWVFTLFGTFVIVMVWLPAGTTPEATESRTGSSGSPVTTTVSSVATAEDQVGAHVPTAATVAMAT
jgi:hypothetical protein